jgi:squalene-hopene/tetraprenyl-beta-curcumene cyclase
MQTLSHPFSLSLFLLLSAGAASAGTSGPGSGAKDVRAAAQKSLDWLSEATPAWQKQHGCYGCHVQAVTMHAMSVAKSHSYRVDDSALKNVFHGLTTIRGGARTAGGMGGGGWGGAESKAFGGIALAHYDQLIHSDARDDLITTARGLLAHQLQDGSVPPKVAHFPIVAGPIHTTWMSVQTWRQAFARTADDVWLAPIRSAEGYLRKRALGYTDGDKPDSVQDLNYAVLGLLEAGAGRSDKGVALLKKMILARQLDDGAWGFRDGEAASPFATGQTLYVLRTLGLTDNDRSVSRGTRWLMKHQGKDGAWSHGGSAKAEAMWGVLGLVAIDVADVEVSGIEDGSRLEKTARLVVRARTNSKKKVSRVRIFLDDVLVAEQKGASGAAAIDPKKLEQGLHLVDVVADVGGSEAWRRVAFYAGDFFLTDVGSRYHADGTRITFRQLSEPSKKERVRLELFDGKKRVFSKSLSAAHGPMQVHFKDDKVLGKKLKAKLSFVDAAGKTRQTVEHELVHDTPAAQAARYAQVQGRLAMEDDKAVANTWVELVDERGQVVQRVKTTRSGQYRFKNVSGGKKLKVRVKKQGFADWSRDVAPVAAGAEAQADAELSRE